MAKPRDGPHKLSEGRLTCHRTHVPFPPPLRGEDSGCRVRANLANVQTRQRGRAARTRVTVQVEDLRDFAEVKMLALCGEEDGLQPDRVVQAVRVAQVGPGLAG